MTGLALLLAAQGLIWAADHILPLAVLAVLLLYHPTPPPDDMPAE